MRVSRCRGDDGISAIVTAVALFGVMSALLLSLDAGNLWQTRRAVMTATDAAALEQARLAALKGPAAACADWKNTIVRNAGSGSEGLTCTVVPGPTPASGYVTIEARKHSAVRFGGIYKKGDTTAFSSSSARWGYVSRIEGARPIAICISNSHVRGYLGLGPDVGIHPSPSVHRVMFTKTNPLDCGNAAPGNWGWVDFDGGSNSNGDLRQWLEFGWNQPVAVGDCDASGTPGTRCAGDPGSSGGSVASVLDTLVASGQPFPIIIFDSVAGNGSNVSYNVTAFIGVILRGYKVNGAQTSRYFDFEFVHMIRSGNCCVPAGIDTGLYGLRLCGIDHDARTSVRCTT